MRNQSQLQLATNKPKEGIWFRSIRVRLFLVLIGFTLLPILLIGLFLGGIATRDLNAKTNELESTALLKGKKLTDWTEELFESLNEELVRDEVRRTNLLLEQDPNSAPFRTLYDAQTEAFNKIIQNDDVFETLFLINSDGVVILSTNQDEEGKDYSLRSLFKYGIQEPYLQTPVYDTSLGHISVVVAQPVRSSSGDPLGVLAGRANFDQVVEIMLEDAGIGETGETYLTDANGTLLTPVRLQVFEIASDAVASQAVIDAVKNKNSASGRYENYAGIPVLGAYRWVPELEVALIAEQSQKEALATIRSATGLLLGAGLVSVVLAVIAALLIGRNLSSPLIELTKTAEKIAGGDLELRADTTRQDEIGTLAKAFNSMTAQLRNLIGNLERRISDRTKQLQNRSEQLLAAAEVGKSATTILDTNELINNVVNLIQERFALYYVGLFLVDNQGKWAELRAGTGKAGREMLKRNHKLAIDDTSMIGWCVSHDQSRIALEAREDPVRLATPDLPETRSEAAIPLRSRGQVIGALSVQSTRPEAFDIETVAVFQTMADQIGIALDNTRLFNETQKALESAHQIFGELSHEAWLEKIRSKPTAFMHDKTGTRQLASAPDLNGDSSLVIPLKTRGRTIGYINAQKRRQEPAGEKDLSATGTTSPRWNPEEVSLLETLTDQLGAALDSARLFEETQKQAERERIVGEATSRMRATLDIQSVLQAAVKEFRDALNLEEVEIRLSPKEYSHQVEHSPDGNHHEK